MPDIYIVDDISPEAVAMLQALKSRSSEPAHVHVTRCREEGAGFMKKWYVGYGHGSIGQCGTTTLFIEGVSILAAKAIQDNRLYNGQETSTRYIDYGKVELYDPLQTLESSNTLQRWMDFYRRALPLTVAHLMTLNPRGNQSEDVYNRTMNARAFDIMRGYLPAAVTTQLSWTGNFEQMYQHLMWLQTHPLLEVRQIAQTMHSVLKERYPSSFSHKDNMEELAYYASAAHYHEYEPDRYTDLPMFTNTIESEYVCNREQESLSARPRHARLPRTLSKYGTFTGRFTLDYGSFRDLQRHRGGRCEMSMVTPDYGFHPWYIESLPPSLQDEAVVIISQQTDTIKALSRMHSPAVAQYYCALGYMVAVEIEYDIPQMVYVAELRSGQTVHPTLREVAIRMLDVVKTVLPCITLYGDTSPSGISYRRGKQTIITV